MDEKIKFLARLDGETIKAELLTFLGLEDIEVDSMGDFIETFVDYIMGDFDYGDC